MFRVWGFGACFLEAHTPEIARQGLREGSNNIGISRGFGFSGV